MKLTIPNTKLNFELTPIGSPVICYRILVNGSRSEISKLVYTEAEALEEIQGYFKKRNGFGLRLCAM